MSEYPHILYHLAYTLGPRSTFWAVSLLRTGLILDALTAVTMGIEFGVWLNSEAGLQLLHYPVLYLYA